MYRFIFFVYCIFIVLFTNTLFAQSFNTSSPEADKWVNHTFRKLTKRQKIAQLIVIRAHSNLGATHVAQVTNLIKQYNVGGLCFFQGGPIRQAALTNYYQSIAKTPLLISIDAEWGLGMRLDSVTNFPKQITMGAMSDSNLVFEVGKAIGNQCKRMGIQVNYAPVVDVNNNPNNPVINDRSFGENKYLVAKYGLEYIKGLQSVNVMACAKHFPGHGDVEVDSHLDLPEINKTIAQLNDLELYPYQSIIKQGVGSIMVAHLFVPAIDSIAHTPTSLSYNNTTLLLKDKMQYKGLIITDGLEMKGITKYFPNGQAAVQAIIAGNDMLCVPIDVPDAIEQILHAIKQKKITWEYIDEKVKKILLAKYHLGLSAPQHIDTAHLITDLNATTDSLNTLVAQKSITVLTNETHQIPFHPQTKIAYIAIGINQENTLATRLKNENNADVYLFPNNASLNNMAKETIEPQPGITITDTKENIALAQNLIDSLKKKDYTTILIGIHNYSRRPANNFGITNASLYIVETLQKQPNALVAYFGNPYSLKFSCEANNLIAAYEDTSITQNMLANMLQGKSQPQGKLPVTVCSKLISGQGILLINE